MTAASEPEGWWMTWGYKAFWLTALLFVTSCNLLKPPTELVVTPQGEPQAWWNSISEWVQGERFYRAQLSETEQAVDALHEDLLEHLSQSRKQKNFLADSDAAFWRLEESRAAKAGPQERIAFDLGAKAREFSRQSDSASEASWSVFRSESMASSGLDLLRTQSNLRRKLSTQQHEASPWPSELQTRWTVRNASESAVQYVARGLLIREHEFGFMLLYEDCTQPILWLKWSTDLGQSEAIADQRTQVTLTTIGNDPSDDLSITADLALLSQSNDGDERLSVFPISNVVATPALSEALESRHAIHVRLGGAAGTLDAANDFFLLGSYAQALKSAQAECQASTLLPGS